MEWLKAVEALRAARQAGVLVTLAAVRGHAPRGPGAKMVVAADHTWGTIGGGNLETAAIDRARELLDAREPELRTVALSDKAPATHGVQCCGGKVTVLLEPLPVVPTVAIFGLGLWVPRMRSCHATCTYSCGQQLLECFEIVDMARKCRHWCTEAACS
jgi:xanthine dehydrogenase accessory factor